MLLWEEIKQQFSKSCNKEHPKWHHRTRDISTKQQAKIRKLGRLRSYEMIFTLQSEVLPSSKFNWR